MNLLNLFKNMGEITYNNQIVRNSENLIIFTGTLTGTTTTSTTLATTTTTTTLIPMVIRWINGTIYTTNSLYPGYFRSPGYVWNTGDENNFISGLVIPNLRFYWEFKAGQNEYSGTLKTSAIEPSDLFNGLYFTETVVVEATTTTSTTLATTTTTTTIATTTTTSTTLATTTTSTTTAYVPQVGDFYQGGIIIITNGITGITALQGNISGNIWGWTAYSKTGLATDGYINTQIMVADPGTAYVALDAWNFTSGIYSDWYLPSLYEMNLMMDVNQNYPLTLDMEGAYWTSNQQNSNNAWVCIVHSDKTYERIALSKQNSYMFRPVRKFYI